MVAKKKSVPDTPADIGAGWGLGVAEPEKVEPAAPFTTDTPSGAPSTWPDDKEVKAAKEAKPETAVKEAKPTNAVGDDLVAIVERIERVSEEIRELQQDKREILLEAKSKGYSAPILRKVLVRRAMDPKDRAEMDALIDIYEHALGMAPDAEV